jgi:superfamily II DNA or RNA helicase
MPTYINTKGYHIDIDDISESELKKVTKELSVSPDENVYTTEGNRVVYQQYRIDGGELIVPRFYGIKKFGVPDDTVFNPEKVKINFNAQLRDYQIPIVATCVDHIKTHGGGILSLPCGRGKTICAINIACTLGVKTLVIVHKTFLQDQWVKCIKQFTGEECGIIRGDIAITDDVKFTVGMIQSIAGRDYGKIFRKFGLVICDETHHFASQFFSQALHKVSCQYTLGLSATLYRNDGLIRVVNWYLGDVAYKESMKVNNQVCSKIITYTSTNKLFLEKTRNIGGKVVPDCTKMTNNLVDIDNRNDIIINIINTLRKNPERKILILSGRKETHLYKLKDRFDTILNEDIQSGKLVKGECKSFLYTGDTKQQDRFDAEKNADVLFATYSMAAEGLDIERLNTIILATPKKDVIQSVGRILRKVLKNGDIRPLIIDIVDDLSLFKSQGQVRERFYEQNKYSIEYYYMQNDKFISPNEYLEIIGNGKRKISDEVPNGYEDVLSVPPVELIEEDVEEKLSNPKTERPKVFSVFDQNDSSDESD